MLYYTVVGLDIWIAISLRSGYIIAELVLQYTSDCYKFFDQSPFVKPGYSEFCISEKNFEICKYVQSERNPCSGNVDHENCKGKFKM